MNKKDGLELLEANEWLNGLDETVRHQLLKAAKIKNYQANQRVHSKGDKGDGLYGVLQGEVRISAATFAGDEIMFSRVQSGNWFGEISVLDGGHRTHDAYTTESSQLALLPKDSLLHACKQNIHVYLALVKLLCTHCRSAFNAIDDFLLYTPEQRMAKQILQRFNVSSMHISVTQQELGALVGVSRQSTNKVLKSWETKGWIKRVYRGIELKELEPLKKLSDSF